MNKRAQEYLLALLVTVRRVGWLPIAVLMAHEVCAHVFDIYRLWPPVDIPLHFLGGFAVAYFTAGGIRVLSEHSLIREPDLFVYIALVFALSCTAAVFWEFAEWIADHTIGTTCQMGLDDTILDLLMGVAGGSIYAISLLMRSGRSSR